MDNILTYSSLALGLFGGMLLLIEIGRRVGVRRLAADPEGARTGTGAIEGAVFALLGLLIAFTFTGAASRFDERRHLVVEEANAIGTAYLRLDTLVADAQPALREAFRRYLDTRLEVYGMLPTDIDAALAALARANAIQGEIWHAAVDAVQAPGALPAAPMLLLPALNQMFDITTTRTMATRTHPPSAIFGMLFALALASALLAGYAMAGGKSLSWLHAVGFAAVMAASVYIILDLEFPRVGLIRLDTFDHALVELRASMH